jgi:hypothetical protein
MSFGIGVAGGAKGVLAVLTNAEAALGVACHHDLMRDAAIAVIRTIPEHLRDNAVVVVEASGHHEFTEPIYGVVDLKIKIGPMAREPREGEPKNG